MSNYPNMSYCQCHNTLLALKQVIDSMNCEGPNFLRELSRDERQAFDALFMACEDFMRVAEEVQDEFEQESESDGQPTEYDEWQSFDPDC